MSVMLLAQYLSQTEGPLYRGVRGKGLAYGSNIYVRPDKKMISLSIYRSADLIRAYEQSKKIVVNLSELFVILINNIHVTLFYSKAPSFNETESHLLILLFISFVG